jgi:hypothetical protein
MLTRRPDRFLLALDPATRPWKRALARARALGLFLFSKAHKNTGQHQFRQRRSATFSISGHVLAARGVQRVLPPVAPHVDHGYPAAGASAVLGHAEAPLFIVRKSRIFDLARGVRDPGAFELDQCRGPLTGIRQLIRAVVVFTSVGFKAQHQEPSPPNWLSAAAPTERFTQKSADCFRKAVVADVYLIYLQRCFVFNANLTPCHRRAPFVRDHATYLCRNQW